MRGKLEKSYNTYIQDRITPAHAGKTSILCNHKR